MGLVAGEAEVRDYFRAIPNVLDADGKIRPDIVSNIERQYGSKARFQQALRDDLLIRKAQRLIWQSLDVSEAEARASLRYAQEEADVALVSFDGAKLPEGLEPDEAAVAALLAEESDRLQKAYDQRKAEFDRPEEIRARHILIRKAEESETEAARATLEKARERFEAGESFADLAAELSDDPGSKEKGGDLGFFPRGRMVKAFEDVAFGLAPGTLSEIVESSFGHHLILVEEKRAAQLTPFEEARQQIARDLALSGASEAAARERAGAIAARIRGGESLVDAAREEELSVARPDPLRRRPNGFVAGLGVAPQVLRAAFTLPEEGGSDPTIHEAGDRKFVLVQLLERRSPSDEELEPVIAAERTRLLQERRESTERAWLEGLRSELTESGDLVYDLSQMR
jgi:peptidyl-prolyl cis-trans isomerase D